MGSHPAVIAAMEKALHTYGANSGGSRNIAGHSPLVEALEASIAQLHKKPAALYFSSGFAANEAALSTLGSQLPDCVIFSDELNHASMIDGIRHAKAKRHVWKHNDLASLEALLASYPIKVPKIIAFESVYSMCGEFSVPSTIFSVGCPNPSAKLWQELLHRSLPFATSLIGMVR